MNDEYSAKLDPSKVDFFCDFILFLRYLEKQPIKRTVTGAISLSDIKPLLSQFKEQERIQEFAKYGWSLRREVELDFLEQIKIIAEMMFVIYKRRGFFYLSKAGKGFLNNLNPINQYKEVVLHFWYRVNWGYFSRGKEINGVNLAEKLQQHQNIIWKTLLSKGTDLIDYRIFCQSLTEYLKLGDYFVSSYDSKREVLSDIQYALFWRNLLRFGCVEIEEKQGEYKWEKEIVKFRSTDLGLYVFHKAIHENYL